MALSIQDYKKEFFRSSRIHMNNAGLAPVSSRAARKVQYWAQRFYEEGFYTDADYVKDVQHSRESLARLIRCDADEIAFFQSTAGGVSQIAFGFDLKEGDEVILWDQEYSSNLYPWQEACRRRKARLVSVPSLADLSTPVERVLSFCTEKTRILAISWVQFQTGARTDIQALVQECQKRNIFVFVDIIQGLGIHEFDFKSWGVDAAAGGSHKWLTSPVGVGYLALKKEHLPRFQPLMIGSATYGTCDDPAVLECVAKNDVSRFEAGSKQVLEITALGASCDLIHEVGVREIEKEVLRLAKKLRTGLEGLGCQLHSPYSMDQLITPMVNFSVPKMENLKENLRQHPINFALRGPGLRLSPHAFNTDEDIERTLECVAQSL